MTFRATSFAAVLATLLSAVVVAALASAAGAADVVYPPGSHLGLAPPPGFIPSDDFQGFRTADGGAGIVMVPLPANAYSELAQSATDAALEREGLAVERRESLDTAFGPAQLFVGRQSGSGESSRKWLMIVGGKDFTALVTVQIPDKALGRYPDPVIREALASLAMRDEVPAAEQLALLPFQPRDLASFRVAATIPHRAVLLSDAARDDPDAGAAAHMIITLASGNMVDARDRDEFANRLFGQISNLKDVRIVSSEPLRMGGQVGHQIIAEAHDAKSGSALKVVQWLRFGSGAHLQMVGTVAADKWDTAYPRFRAVRDGLDLR